MDMKDAPAVTPAHLDTVTCACCGLALPVTQATTNGDGNFYCGRLDQPGGEMLVEQCAARQRAQRAATASARVDEILGITPTVTDAPAVPEPAPEPVPEPAPAADPEPAAEVTLGTSAGGAA